jgi:hypothetical protein
MQIWSLTRRGWWHSCFALVCILAVSIVSGVQVAHWDAERAPGHSLASSVQTSDGLCPICYSVPVGHGAAPAPFQLFHFEGTFAVTAVAPASEGIQPEFHLHIRPPPVAA